jgi:hypothetical protein
MEQQKYERRKRARSLLFGKAEGSFRKLSQREKLFVSSVLQEAYDRYLHLFHTGESAYDAWRKRRQVNLVNKDKPLTLRQWKPMWYGSQKVRYLRHDLKEATVG